MIQQTTIADIVVKDYRAAEIFKRYGIDYGYDGKRKMYEVCLEKHISAVELASEIDIATSTGNKVKYNFNDWPLSFLCDYIVNVHHKYVTKNLELINAFAQKTAELNGKQYPETIRIAENWKKLMADFETHLQKEELVLFPYIKNLEKLALGEIRRLPQSYVHTVKSPIRIVEQEHDEMAKLIDDIQCLSNNFNPNLTDCTTCGVLCDKLKAFQDDSQEHIHLEVNILFPKAIALEERLNSF